MFLLILYNFVTCCCPLIPYCRLALVMTNSALNSTCLDDGSVNVYLCMYVCTYAICGENTEVLDVEYGDKYCNEWILNGLSHCQLRAESKCSMLN